jgi:hypothetical protein
MIVLDRFEGDRAVLLVGDEAFDVPRGVLPAGAREGAALVLTLDPEAGAGRLAEAEARVARLKARNPPTSTEFDL